MSTTTHTPDASVAVDSRQPFDRSAPLDRHHVYVLAGAYVVLLTIYTAVGFAIIQWWDTSSAGAREADLNRWFEGHRTEQRNQLAEWGSALSDTETEIALVLMLLPLMLWMYRRWHDWAFLTIALLFEVSVFGISSKIVGRDRPPVEQLDGAPTASWPSGHIAASVVFYAGLAMVAFWHTRWWVSRTVFTVIADRGAGHRHHGSAVPGHHYATDAVGGVVLAIVSLLLVRELMIRSGRDPRRRFALKVDASASDVARAARSGGSAGRGGDRRPGPAPGRAGCRVAEHSRGLSHFLPPPSGCGPSPAPKRRCS